MSVLVQQKVEQIEISQARHGGWTISVRLDDNRVLPNDWLKRKTDAMRHAEYLKKQHPTARIMVEVAA